jgi:hypothetical protein
VPHLCSREAAFVTGENIAMFRQINDNLIEAFIHLVDQYEKWARASADEAVQRALTDAGADLQAAGKVLNLFVDDSIPGNASFASVKRKAFLLLEPGRFALVSNYMRNVAFDKAGFEWSHYTTLSPTIKRNLRHLFSELDFAGRVEDAPLLDAIVFLQALLPNGQIAPTDQCLDFSNGAHPEEPSTLSVRRRAG